MYSMIDLINMALREISVREIASIQDESVEAINVRQVLPLVIRGLLSKAPWRFAKTVVELPKLDKETIEPTTLTRNLKDVDLYLYPTDVIRVLNVSTREQADATYELQSIKLLDQPAHVSIIACRGTEAELTYVRYNEDVSTWSDPFQIAFVHSLAYRLAPSSGQADAKTTQLQLATMYTKEAMAVNGNERRKHLNPGYGALEVRF